MAKSPERASVPGPAFIRQLARLTDVEFPSSQRALSDRLSQWIDWNRAVALSRALDGQPCVDHDAPAAFDQAGFNQARADDCARVRDGLVQAIHRDRELAPPDQPTGEAVAVIEAQAPTEIDYARFSRRYVDHQRAMQAATGRLRGQLRDLLARQPGDMARLAEVDALMELTLSPREQTLLDAVPALLGQHFERLRQAAQPLASNTDNTPSTEATAAPMRAWLDLFRKDMQRVLLAELDARFLPIDSLLAALHPR